MGSVGWGVRVQRVGGEGIVQRGRSRRSVEESKRIAQTYIRSCDTHPHIHIFAYSRREVRELNLEGIRGKYCQCGVYVWGVYIS